MSMHLSPAAYSNGATQTVASPPQSPSTKNPYRSSIALAAHMAATPGYLSQGPRGKLCHSAVPRIQGGNQTTYDDALENWVDSGKPLPTPQPTPQAAKPAPVLPTPTSARSIHSHIHQQQQPAASTSPTAATVTPVTKVAPMQAAPSIPTLPHAAQQAAPVAPSQSQSPAPAVTMDQISAMLAMLLQSQAVHQFSAPVAPSPAVAPVHTPATIPLTITPADASPQAGVPVVATPTVPAEVPNDAPHLARLARSKRDDLKVADHIWLKEKLAERMEGVQIQLVVNAILPNGNRVTLSLENGGVATLKQFSSGNLGFNVNGRTILTDPRGEQWGMQLGCNLTAIRYLGKPE